MTVEELMAQSMAYERAQARVGDAMNKLSRERNKAYDECRETGETLDPSYDLALQAMKTAREELRRTGNRLWKQAEQTADIYPPAVENLANAVVERAVYDYEMALSGAGNALHRADVERFARDGAEAYTGIDLKQVLRKCREAYPIFAAMVREHGDEIIQETRRNREKHINLELNTYKCPMCGGALYAYGTAPRDGLQRINCTGCSFTGTYAVDEKGSKHGRKENDLP